MEQILTQENSLILIKSGLDFLEYMSDTANHSTKINDSMTPQLERDRIIIDIFQMFTQIILYDNSRFKTIQKYKELKEMIFYYLIDTNRDYERKDI